MFVKPLSLNTLTHASTSPKPLSRPAMATVSPLTKKPLRFGEASLMDDTRYLIDFSAPVVEEAVSQVVMIMQKMALEKKALKDPGSIKLLINSPGGSVDAGFKLLGVIRNLGMPVDTIVMGSAASMGAALSIGAASKGRRFMDRYSKLMIHQPSVQQLGGNAEELTNYVKEINRTRDIMDNLISRHTGVPVERVRQMTSKDSFIYPLEALKEGFVDWVLISGDKGLNKDSIKNLSHDEIQRRDQINAYDDLPLVTIDPMLSKPQVSLKGAKPSSGASGSVLELFNEGALPPVDKSMTGQPGHTPDKAPVTARADVIQVQVSQGMRSAIRPKLEILA